MDFRFGPRAFGLISLAAILLVASLIYRVSPFLFNKMDRSREKRKPSIIILLIDALRRDALGCYGSKIQSSPNLDEFAEDAVVFENYYAQSSWTVPQTATLLTGMSPLSHGLRNLWENLSDDITTFTEILKRAGYSTGVFVENAVVRDYTNIYQGVDLYRYDETDVVKDVLNWFDRLRQDEKFFAYIHLLGAHSPYSQFSKKMEGGSHYPEIVRNGEAFLLYVCTDRLDYLYRKEICDRNNISPDNMTPEWVDYVKKLYYGQMEYYDGVAGGILKELRRRQFFEDSIVFILSDHGEELYDHRSFFHGRTLYQEIVHSPLIAHFPSCKRRIVREPVLTMDIVPSILDFLGMEQPGNMDGRSFIPFLYGESIPSDEPILLATSGAETCWHPWRRCPSQYGLINGDWKLIDFGNGRIELYDIANDPEEKIDLYNEKLSHASSLLEKLNALKGNFTVLEKPGKVRLPEKEMKRLKERLKALGYVE